MDFLDKFQQKYIPNVHAFRYQQRIKKVQSLKETCLNNPQQLGYQDLRIILRVLKYYHLLHENPQSQKVQINFVKKVMTNFVSASVISFSPFFFRQFHSWRSSRKFLLISGLFICSYGLMMYPAVCQINNYNRKIAQQNIYKFSIDIEQKRMKSFQSTKYQ